MRHIKNSQERKQGLIATEETETQMLKMAKQYHLQFKLEEDFQRQE